MASALIHIAVANEVNKRLKRQESEYLIGSIAPDIAKIVGIDRNVTHFQKTKKDFPDTDKFLNKYKKNTDNDFVMGYYIHLLTDYFWFKYFFSEIVNENTITKLNGDRVKLSNEELTKLIYDDYTNLNLKLIEEYNLDLKIFYNEIPFIEDIIQEIPVNRLNELIDKMGVIIENSKKDKTYVFNIEDIKKFISTCTELIIGILEEKELL